MFECPKDPNTSTLFEPSDELERIDNFVKTKKKLNTDTYSIKKKFLNMVINKIKNSHWILDANKDASDSAEEDDKFSDIFQYKKQFVISKIEKEIENMNV